VSLFVFVSGGPMETAGNMRVIELVGIGALVAGGLAACSGKVEDNAPLAPASGATGGSTGGSGSGTGGSASGGKGGASGGSGGSSSGSGGSSSGSGGSSGTPADCSADTHGSVAPARRLTADEWANAIEDLFGITAGSKYPGGSGESLTG